MIRKLIFEYRKRIYSKREGIPNNHCLNCLRKLTLFNKDKIAKFYCRKCWFKHMTQISDILCWKCKDQKADLICGNCGIKMCHKCNKKHKKKCEETPLYLAL